MNHATPNTEPATYTVEEMRQHLRMGRSAAYEAVRRGQIPSVKIGGRYFIPRVRLEAFLRGEEQPAPAANR
jgi:excisionase family DNA binding protein